jgi:glucan 1,3-beta-glucosidase
MTKLALVIVAALAIVSGSWAWPYGETQVRGVNLGSWLVLEKWITPVPFEGTNANDEWQLCQQLGYAEAERRLKAHWESWVTENDIIQLKNAGINHLRIPIGYWAIEIPAGEPWVWGSWDYVMRAVGWAKKHGMQVMIDLHGGPGSQNGNDHSGHSGAIGFYYNDENLNLASRVLGEIAKRVNTDEWRSTVTIIQLLNEPVLWDDYNYRLDRLKQFYRQAYDAVRAQNTDIVVAVHDAFIGHENWYYLREDTHYFWVMLDAHYYQVFGDEWGGMTCDQHAYSACRFWQSLPAANEKLWTVVGEWSLATPSNCEGTIRTMAKQQIGVYERASGWFMWNFKHGAGWNEWDFLASVNKGWIDLHSPIVATC